MVNEVLEFRNGSLHFGGVDVEELASQRQTPFFVMSANRLRHNYEKINHAFAQPALQTRLYYSVKTNYNLEVLKVLRAAGSGAEVCSGMELFLAKKAGFEPNEIVMDGACWTDDEISLALRSQIAMLNIDSDIMFQKVTSVAKATHTTPQIAIRVNPNIKIPFLRNFIEGYIKRFGLPIDEAEKLYNKAFKTENVAVDGISMHIGSGIINPKHYVEALKVMMTLYARLSRKLSMLNIGGGYPVQSMKSVSTTAFILRRVGLDTDRYEKTPCIDVFAKEIWNCLSPCVKSLSFPPRTLALEPGRYITSDAGILVTRVASVKNKWVFLDGGINLLSESAFFSRRGFLIVDQAKNNGTPKKVNIAGNGLNTVDVLAISQPFPSVNVGDVVVVLDAGAYSLSRANQFIYLRPEALMVDNGAVRCIQRKEIYDDVLRLYRREEPENENE
jgi:diaminopimelate decarboxylase